MAAINILPATTITTAVTGSLSNTVALNSAENIRGIALFAKFVYGSGGTTAKAWLQTSLDNGTTWHDVANVAFTTASLNKVATLLDINVAPATPTDATLADNTQNNGLLGGMFRVKYTTTGTYAGGTTLEVWITLKK